MPNDPFEKREDDGVLTVFFWYDDEPADENELWAAMYDGDDEYDGHGGS
jgi:hypothetical protein